MFDLSIVEENNIYKVSYKTDDKAEAYDIFSILNNKMKENDVYMITQEYENILKGKYPISQENKKQNYNIIDDSEYDINTNRYINKVNNYEVCPFRPFKNCSWKLVSNIYLQTFYKIKNIEQACKDVILKEWSERGLNKDILLSEDKLKQEKEEYLLEEDENGNINFGEDAKNSEKEKSDETNADPLSQNSRDWSDDEDGGFGNRKK